MNDPEDLRLRLEIALGYIDGISETFQHQKAFDRLRPFTAGFRKEAKIMWNELTKEIERD